MIVVQYLIVHDCYPIFNIVHDCCPIFNIVHDFVQYST